MLGIIRSLRRRLRKSKGYTLVELAAVTAIAAGITAVMLPVAKDRIEKAKITNAMEEAKLLATAVINFYNDTGQLPNSDTVKFLFTGTTANVPLYDTSELTSDDAKWPDAATNGSSISDWLISQPSNFAGWDGPYLTNAEADEALDPWGHAYLIQVEETTSSGDAAAIYVISAGPNGIIETSRLQEADGFSANDDNDSTTVESNNDDDIVVRIK